MVLRRWMGVLVMACGVALAGCGDDDDAGATDAAAGDGGALGDAGLDARVNMVDAGPGLTWVVPTHDYGNIAQGGMTGFGWMLRNDGPVTTGAITVALAGPDATEFNFPNMNCAGMTLAPGAMCFQPVRFGPQLGRSPGMRMAFLDASASPGGTARATATGTALAPPILAWVPNAASFGQQALASSSSPMTFTLTNQSSTVTVTALTFVTVGNIAEFPEDVVANQCVGNQSLAPGASCVMRRHFTPTSLGQHLAGVQCNGTTPSGTVTVALSLSGEGI
ncbi:MAG: hypothetical protein IT370_05450 [Deltaproteobacteria bacterium]|nr:hypothetical protein [Deltaproteobacteria bacterium]